MLTLVHDPLRWLQAVRQLQEPQRQADRLIRLVVAPPARLAMSLMSLMAVPVVPAAMVEAPIKLKMPTTKGTLKPQTFRPPTKIGFKHQVSSRQPFTRQGRARTGGRRG